jgi:zinc-ribbon domain
MDVSPSQGAITCPNCGNQTPVGASFCPACGRVINTTQVPSSTPPAAPPPVQGPPTFTPGYPQPQGYSQPPTTQQPQGYGQPHGYVQPPAPIRPNRKPIFVGLAVIGLVVVVIAGALIVVGVGGSHTSEVTIAVPAEFAAGFQSGAPNGEYVFYALADKVPDWKSVAEAGIFICSVNRPPLIPQKERAMIDSGGIMAGTVVTLNTQDITGVVGIKELLVTVPAAVNGCTEVAVKQMSDTPGMLLMTDAKASFAEQSQLVKVLLK